MRWHEQFERHAAARPAAAAIAGPAGSLDYGELARRAAAVAGALQRAGVAPGALVALCEDRPAELIAALLGVLRAGCAYLPLEPGWPDARLRAAVARTRPAAALVGAPWRALFADVPAVLETGDALAAAPGEARGAAGPDDPCYAVFTSGSTGTPKAVLVAHRNVEALFAPFTARYGLGPDDRWAACHSAGFGFAAFEIFGALTHGACLVPVPPAVRRDPAALAALLARERVSVLCQTPTAFRQNLLDPGFAPAGDAALRLVVLSGEPLAAADLARWFARHPEGRPGLVNTYAITETGGQVTVRDCRPGDAGGGVGRPLPGVELAVLDAAGRPVPDGEPGELHVGGFGVALGYLGEPRSTAERFVERAPGGGAPRRFYRTGDRARLVDGELEILGRVDRQLKWRGHRVEPAEIEAALQDHPRIAEAAVGLTDEPAPRLAAWIAPRAAPADGEPELWPAIGPYQVYDPWLYDLMSAEPRRLSSYREALRRHARGRVVLDIGTGEHAVLARLAVEAGARRVYAVEVLPEAAAQARALVRAQGLDDRIEIIEADMDAVTLPEPVEVATQGIVGNIGSADGIVSIWNAARRCFAPGCVPVPARCRTLVAPAELPAGLAARPAFGALARRYAERVYAAEGRRFDLRLCVRNFPAAGLLAAPAVFEDLDFSAALAETDAGEATFRVARAGRCDGFVLWTVLDTGGGAPVDYFAEQTAWLPVFVPLPDGGVALPAGATVQVAWSRRPGRGRCPDYRLAGRAGDTAFDCLSRVAEPGLGTTALHRALDAAGGADDLAPEALRGWLAARLPAPLVPAVFVRVPRLPVNANGKLDRDRLPAPSRARPALATPLAAPRDLLEARLAALWAEVLDLETVGRDDAFFDLGGDSIAAVRLTSAMQRLLDEGVPLAALFDAPTVGGLAAWLRRAFPAAVARLATGPERAPAAIEEGDL